MGYVRHYIQYQMLRAGKENNFLITMKTFVKQKEDKYLS
jgi:hypothetical protein